MCINITFSLLWVFVQEDNVIEGAEMKEMNKTRSNLQYNKDAISDGGTS